MAVFPNNNPKSHMAQMYLEQKRLSLSKASADVCNNTWEAEIITHNNFIYLLKYDPALRFLNEKIP